MQHWTNWPLHSKHAVASGVADSKVAGRTVCVLFLVPKDLLFIYFFNGGGGVRIACPGGNAAAGERLYLYQAWLMANP